MKNGKLPDQKKEILGQIQNFSETYHGYWFFVIAIYIFIIDKIPNHPNNLFLLR